jgi:hypothetical protein
MGPTALLPFRRKACCGFFHPEKSNGFSQVRTRDLGYQRPYEVLRIVYFSLAYSIISYGIIFGGASLYSKVIFKIQRRIIRVIMNSDSKDSCHELFTKLYILPVHSEYMVSILLFVVKKEVYSIQILMFIILIQN